MATGPRLSNDRRSPMGPPTAASCNSERRGADISMTPNPEAIPQRTPDGGVYVECEVCGERAYLAPDRMTRNRAGQQVTVEELFRTETLDSCGPWRCGRHKSRRLRRYA